MNVIWHKHLLSSEMAYVNMTAAADMLDENPQMLFALTLWVIESHV